MGNEIHQSIAQKDELEEQYQNAQKERELFARAIIDSAEPKRVIIAGPGTGKTYIFKDVLKEKGKTLTLTFVNTLVEDLSLDLYGISEVRTLHSFARRVLGGSKVNIYPKLTNIIEEDAIILIGETVDFNKMFYNLDDEDDYIKFYKGRKDYYEHYGYTDIIYAAVKWFERRNDRIPEYELIVVDEFQDFNKLEVALIDFLSLKSPILIVGDDDQALYDFKSASPDHIRDRFGDKYPDYTPFTLPYCSRCVRVVVDAANDVINNASKNGYLRNRAAKDLIYFNDEEKNAVSAENPKIVYAKVFSKAIPWFIEKNIEQLAEMSKCKFSVLIISPTRIQSQSIVNSLRKKGFRNVVSTKIREEKEPTLIDGVKILLEDKDSNLGWRIAVKFLLDDDDLAAILKIIHDDSSKRIKELVNDNIRSEVTELLRTLRAVRKGQPGDKRMLDDSLSKIGIEPLELAEKHLREELSRTSRGIGKPGIRNMPIVATTIQGSKGLAADHVFITHFDDQYFIRNRDKEKISDQDICSFLVALTRAMGRVILISTKPNVVPTFLTWIAEDRIERVSMSK